MQSWAPRMTMPGGQAEKFGNRFEGWWTIRQFARLMEEELLSITIESPWKSDEKFEFHLLSRDDYQEHYQVKRRATGVGNWSLAALDGAGLLEAFFDRVIQAPNDMCVFASEDQAEPLRTLTTRAREAVDFNTYKNAHLSSDKWSKEFEDLCTRIRKYFSTLTDEDIFKYLRRMSIENQDETTLKRDLLARLGKLVDGDPNNILATLAQCALDNAHGRRITAPDVWQHLQERGFERLTGYPNQRLLEATDRFHQRMLSSYLGRDTLGELVPRPEVEELHTSISNADGSALIVTGEAGAGKSEVLLQLREAVKADALPFLFLRVDQLRRCYSPDSLLSEDAFPQRRTPVDLLLTLQKMCGEREPAVLFLDQVDQLSMITAANVVDTQFFNTIAGVFAAANNHPSIVVVVACRKFDLEHDHRFRGVFSREGVKHVHLRGLPHEEVRKKVDGLGYSSTLSTEQLALFSNPYHLVLLAQLSPPTQGASVALETSLQLYERFWDEKRQYFQASASGPNWNATLDALVSRMIDSQLESLSRDDVDDLSDSVDRLCSMNVLTRDQSGRVSFFHPRFFDYVFARRFHHQHDSLTEYLRREGQHLRLRNPMRMILTYMRARALNDHREMLSYLHELKELLDPNGAQDIRPHLCSIATSFLAQVSDPMLDELELVKQMVCFNDDFYRREGQKVLAGGEGWLRLMDDEGIIDDWFKAQEGPLD